MNLQGEHCLFRLTLVRSARDGSAGHALCQAEAQAGSRNGAAGYAILWTEAQACSRIGSAGHAIRPQAPSHWVALHATNVQNMSLRFSVGISVHCKCAT